MVQAGSGGRTATSGTSRGLEAIEEALKGESVRDLLGLTGELMLED